MSRALLPWPLRDGSGFRAAAWRAARAVLPSSKTPRPRPPQRPCRLGGPTTRPCCSWRTTNGYRRYRSAIALRGRVRLRNPVRSTQPCAGRPGCAGRIPWVSAARTLPLRRSPPRRGVRSGARRLARRGCRPPAMAPRRARARHRGGVPKRRLGASGGLGGRAVVYVPGATRLLALDERTAPRPRPQRVRTDRPDPGTETRQPPAGVL